jgi:dihydrofolate reductase
MKKLIAAINMTLDGFCDHTAITTADDELHEHYNELLKSAGAVIYGRVTYQLMEFWASVVKNPTGNKSMDEFAITMDNVPKIVFSHTLKNTELKNTRIANGDIKEEVLALKQSPNGGNKDIFVGSPGLIVATMHLDLIDEYQICVHPVIAGNGLPLFKNNERMELKLLKTKTFGSGAVILYYEPVKK